MGSKYYGGVLKAATEVSNSLGAIGKRMEQSGHKWAKIVEMASQWIGYAARINGFIDAIQLFLRYLPAICDQTYKRLVRIKSVQEKTPTDVLEGTEKTGMDSKAYEEYQRQNL
ncbi:hypothetical protein BWQ96_08062 [Gracilariopsis chorda]|uniref:Uncharacterized protein n=1 Tax=Gracilariopsis chorda TaxID=448386 RepID=A0A2V3IJG5_9FLOR|nr:hypothetical protein BWQ96_08062 [Gracilariopsis chorda]|eukprot:PXF42234.1 hypothetical protein BWQ96_08062 [Gracilariopsis chorda]